MPSTLEVLTDAVRAKIGDPGLGWGVGKTKLSEHKAPPVVIWVPKGGTVGPPMPPQHWEGEIDGKAYKARHIHDERLVVHAFLWAADYEGWERLQNRVLSAVRGTFLTASEPGDFSIDTEDQRAAVTNLGHAGMQSFTWKLRVCEYRTQVEREIGTYVPARGLVKIINVTLAHTLLPVVDPAP